MKQAIPQLTQEIMDAISGDDELLLKLAKEYKVRIPAISAWIQRKSHRKLTCPATLKVLSEYYNRPAESFLVKPRTTKALA